MFDFEPRHLKNCVNVIEQLIGEKTGGLLRLDLEKYFSQLEEYKNSNFVPEKHCIEVLSSYISEIKNRELLNSYILLATEGLNKHILEKILDYYFINFEDSDLCVFLLKNINKVYPETDKLIYLNEHKESFFSPNNIEHLVNVFFDEDVHIFDIMSKMFIIDGTQLQSKLYDEILSHNLERLIENYELDDILQLLKHERLVVYQHHIWTYSILKYFDSAMNLKLKNEDHKLFSEAKLQLGSIITPTGEPSFKWMKISDDAKKMYQSWLIGHRIDKFFGGLDDRSVFWRSQILQITNVSEVFKAGEIYGFFINIGKYVFLEFKTVGAIYIYSINDIRIEKHITNDLQVKIRNKVINSGEDNEGRIRHQGQWQNKTMKFIRMALND